MSDLVENPEGFSSKTAHIVLPKQLITNAKRHCTKTCDAAHKSLVNSIHVVTTVIQFYKIYKLIFDD